MQNARMSHAQRAQTSGDVCFVRAYAKINLTLDILSKRADGYHDLATVMQVVDLYDTLCISTTSDNQVQIVCSIPELNNADNLAARAVDLVRLRFGITQGVLIELHKHIPMAAGLGGGSSDAAAVLLALQRWWQLQLSSTDLLEMASSLGSDVPFFLTGGLALCEGRGERVTAISAHWPTTMRWLLLLKPAISVSTATVFRSLPASDYTNGTHSRAVCTALQAGQTPELEHLHNCFERSLLERYQEVALARETFLQAGAAFVRLSGTGPTLFAPFPDLNQALQVQKQLQAQGYEVYLSRAIHPNDGMVSVF
ncbi:MAG TPA: 4-(cytidine 5'-diphospho)-2-C-methyl-D-erythritol kinase [Ktedonobacteraceae bacterium]|nr:4-(cytidine 5'-diphospho)-2-C-methyl-D-erythritol kinase [Ktedonobacteraceae bacterium]